MDSNMRKWIKKKLKKETENLKLFFKTGTDPKNEETD